MSIVRHLVLIPVLVVASSAIAAPTASAAAPSSSTRLGAVTFSFSLDKSVYAPGEPIRFRLTLANATSQDASVEYPTSQPYDVLVFRRDQLVWQWSQGMAFLQVLTRLTLRPGEIRVFEIVWDQKDASGRQVPTGEYEAQARFPVMGEPLVTQRLPLRITAGAGRTPPQIASRPSTQAGATVGEVVVNGLVVLRFREPAGGFTAAERAEIVADRLRRMFEAGLNPRQLRVDAVGGEVAIVWRDRLLLTVDANHARLNRTTRPALARVWRQRLIESLSS